MKKTQWFIMTGLAVLVIFIGITVVRVQAAPSDGCVCGQYIDADVDGICD